MRVIDLFCGCGGFSEGFRQAGFEVVLAVDNWEVALKSHEVNHPECEHWNRDILTITPDELVRFKADVLIGSPPCPEYSTLSTGYRPEKPDTRLLYKFLNLARGCDFKYYVGENVMGVRPYLNGTHYQVLWANNFRMFHGRARVFFGKYPFVQKVTKNPIRFPTPCAKKGGDDILVQWSLHQQKSRDSVIAYPHHVAHWIMGFDENYQLIGSEREKRQQIGNAVCPPVARAIADAIQKQEDGGL